MQNQVINPSASAAVIESTDAAITAAITRAGVALEGVASLRDAFAPHFQGLAVLVEQARGVKTDEPQAARRLRLDVRAVRIAAEQTHKSQKEDSLRRGRAIDGVLNVFKYQAEPVEEALLAIEKSEERREAKRLADLQATRQEMLRPYVDPSLSIDLTMAEQHWQAVFAGFKAAHDLKVAADAKAKADKEAADRIAAEAELKRRADEAAERDRMRAENERLTKIAADERAARKQAEAKAKAERAAADLAAADTKRLSDAKLAAETKRQDVERDRQQEIARQERDKREAAEAALAKIEHERMAREQAADTEAKKAKAAPDKAKITALAGQVRALTVPDLSSDLGPALTARIAEQLAKFAAWLDAEAGKL